MTNLIKTSVPSNIALIKYWGKHGVQLPKNPSLSFTLSAAQTHTSLEWKEGTGKLKFSFEGKEAPSFLKKIESYRETWTKDFPILKSLDLKIESSNTFPHSAGIASSASSMGSLSLAFSHLMLQFGELEDEKNKFFETASHFARLGSGSASRSLYGGVVTWGKWSEQTSDEYASPLELETSNWKEWGDAILIVSSDEKPVSSRQGHALMKDHPYAEVRYATAKNRLNDLIDIMNRGDELAFCELVETEALELHGLMMNSTPSFILMRPESLQLIEQIRRYRKESGIPVCFTLDAGPNVHMLYPLREKDKVMSFLNSKLTPYLENGNWLDDKVGMGPEVSFE